MENFILTTCRAYANFVEGEKGDVLKEFLDFGMYEKFARMVMLGGELVEVVVDKVDGIEVVYEDA